MAGTYFLKSARLLSTPGGSRHHAEHAQPLSFSSTHPSTSLYLVKPLYPTALLRQALAILTIRSPLRCSVFLMGTSLVLIIQLSTIPTMTITGPFLQRYRHHTREENGIDARCLPILGYSAHCTHLTSRNTEVSKDRGLRSSSGGLDTGPTHVHERDPEEKARRRQTEYRQSKVTTKERDSIPHCRHSEEVWFEVTCRHSTAGWGNDAMVAYKNGYTCNSAKFEAIKLHDEYWENTINNYNRQYVIALADSRIRQA